MSIDSLEIAKPAMPDFRVDVITPHANHLSHLICGYAFDEGEVVLEILEDTELMGSWFIEQYKDQRFDLTVTLFTPEGEERVFQELKGLRVTRVLKTSRMSWEKGDGLVLKYTVLCDNTPTEILYPADEDPYAEPVAPEGDVFTPEFPPDNRIVNVPGNATCTDLSQPWLPSPPARRLGVPYDWHLVRGCVGDATPDPIVGPITHYDDGGAPRKIDDGLTIHSDGFCAPPRDPEGDLRRHREECARRDLPWIRGTED